MPIALIRRLRSARSVSNSELFRLAAWKTGQGLGSLTVNTEEEIQDRTRAALDAIRPWRDQSVSGLTSEAMWANWRGTARQAIGDAAVNSGLLGLDGVGYPMATAILAILEPTVWPGLDRWGTLTRDQEGDEFCVEPGPAGR